MENRNYNDSESQNDNMEDDLEGTFNDRDTWLSPNKIRQASFDSNESAEYDRRWEIVSAFSYLEKL